MEEFKILLVFVTQEKYGLDLSATDRAFPAFCFSTSCLFGKYQNKIFLGYPQIFQLIFSLS